MCIIYTEDSDYQPSEQTVVFRPPSVEECFSVAIINDNIHEGLETFSVSLSSPDGRITVSVPSIEVSIGDDDSKLHMWQSQAENEH